MSRFSWILVGRGLSTAAVILGMTAILLGLEGFLRIMVLFAILWISYMSGAEAERESR